MLFRGGFFYGKNGRVFKDEEGHGVPAQLGRVGKTIHPLIHRFAGEEYERQGYNQTKERVAERGGFGTLELVMLLADALLRERGVVPTAADSASSEHPGWRWCETCKLDVPPEHFHDHERATGHKGADE
jgi:hypothetical protein